MDEKRSQPAVPVNADPTHNELPFGAPTPIPVPPTKERRAKAPLTVHATLIATDPPKGPAHVAGAPAVPGYEVLDKLGEGGMGVVYKARQLKANRLVALKMIRGSHYAS